MAQQTKLESIVQKMQEENSSDEDISAVIQEYKKQNPEEVNSIIQKADSIPEEYGPPISAAPPEQPPPSTAPGDFWGGVKESLFSGEAMRASDQSAKGWMQGAVLDLPHGMWEGAKMLATTNPIGAAAYGLMGKELPVNEAAGALKDLPYNLGKATEMAGSQPYEYGRMLGNIFGQPAMGEAAFGNVPGLPSGLDIVKGGGRGIEATGRVMQNYHPFSEVITRGLAGTAGSSAFGPYGTAGALFVRPPKFLTGMEAAAGRGVERGGQWIRDIDGSVTRAELENFWGRNTKPGGGEPPDGGGGVGINVEPGPFDRTPFHPSDAEALRQFRESQGTPPPPVEPTINQATDPLSRAPFNESDMEALAAYRNWKGGPEYVPPPMTINETTPGPFDKYGMMDPDTPEPGITPVNPDRVDPGRPLTPFEIAMRNKKDQGIVTPEEAPPVDVEGNELSFSQQEVPPAARGTGGSINPEGDIRWDGTPDAETIRQIESTGKFKFDSLTNMFKKLVKDTKGEFTPGEMLENLRQLFKREPTAVELEDAIRRQHKPGEPSGAVAPFLSESERAQRLDDLGNTPEVQSGLTGDPAELWQQIMQAQEEMGKTNRTGNLGPLVRKYEQITGKKLANLSPDVRKVLGLDGGQEFTNLEDLINNLKNKRGPRKIAKMAEGMKTTRTTTEIDTDINTLFAQLKKATAFKDRKAIMDQIQQLQAERTVANSPILKEDPQFAPTVPQEGGLPVDQIRQQNVMNPARQMDPRMAARVEAQGGPREFDFTKQNPEVLPVKPELDMWGIPKDRDMTPEEVANIKAWYEKQLMDSYGEDVVEGQRAVDEVTGTIDTMSEETKKWTSEVKQAGDEGYIVLPPKYQGSRKDYYFIRKLSDGSDVVSTKPPAPKQLGDTEIKQYLDNEDSQIADYLKSEDAQPPEATDIEAWRKLKNLGKKFLGDESGEFDPNTLWWNLRRYFNRVPTEAELTRGMQIDPETPKPGHRAQQVKNKIANMPWADEIRKAAGEMSEGKSSAWRQMMDKLEQDEKLSQVRLPRQLVDAADALWDQLGYQSVENSKTLINEVKERIEDISNVEIARANRDDLGTMSDNSVNKIQKDVFDELYELADTHYRKLRNPGLESPKPNQAKPIEDAFTRSQDRADSFKEDKFGPKPEVPSDDKWDVDPDRTPSNLPPGHVDIEGTRFIDLSQNMKMSEPGESTPKSPEPPKKQPSRKPIDIKRARKSDDLWRVLIGGDKPKFFEESNLKAEELINRTTDRETLEVYAEALDEWAAEHTKDTDHRMAGWMMDLRKLVMKKLEE